MDARTAITAVGAAITAFLVVAVAVIELLDVEFSALVGLPVGLLAGAIVFVVLLLHLETVDERLQWLAAGTAGFGYGIVLALAANYVNLADVGFEATVGVGVALALIAFLAGALLDRREPTT